MKDTRYKALLWCSVVVMACLTAAWILMPAQAAEAPAGALTAQADGNVTLNRFVKLTADGNIAEATSCVDSIIGICEQTATNGKITKFAPYGTRTQIYLAGLTSAGDFLTAGAAGKGVVVTLADANDSRIAAIAMQDGNTDGVIDCMVVAGAVNNAVNDGNLVIAGRVQAGVIISDGNFIAVGDVKGATGTITGAATIAGGYASTGVSVSAAGGILAAGDIQGDANIIGAVALIGGGYGATGSTLSAAGGLSANGDVISDANVKGAKLTDGTATLTGGKITGLNLDANNTNNAVTNLPPSSLKAYTSAAPGVPFVVIVDANATGDTDYTVPTGYRLRVLDAWVAQDGASSDPNGVVTVKSTTNAISDVISLAHGDHAITRAATLVDAYAEIAAAGKLRVSYNEVDTVGVRVHVLCAWAVP